jgi:hypothetical protein
MGVAGGMTVGCWPRTLRTRAGLVMVTVSVMVEVARRQYPVRSRARASLARGTAVTARR